jgi:hypothetical protein
VCNMFDHGRISTKGLDVLVKYVIMCHTVLINGLVMRSSFSIMHRLLLICMTVL